MPKRKRPTETNINNNSNSTTTKATKPTNPPPPPPPTTTTKAAASTSITKSKTTINVPDPPQSLISLIQKDDSVLQYFTILQQSLEEDVQEWKHKALEYRSRLKSLQNEIDCKNGDNNNNNKKKTKKNTGNKKVKNGSANRNIKKNGMKKYNNDDPPLESIELVQRTNNSDVDNTDNGDLFHDLPSSKGSSSDDEDDDDDDSFMNEFKAKMISETNKSDKQNVHTYVVKYIIEAYECLNSLGISLYDTNPIMNEHDSQHLGDDKKQKDNNTEIDGENQITLRKTKRSDIAIITHLMRTLRTLIRAPTLEMKKFNNSTDDDDDVSNFFMKWFQPFVPINFQPSCYEYDNTKWNSISSSMLPSSGLETNYQQLHHPLIQGLHSICHILAIWDMYCSSHSPFAKENEWESLFATINSIDNQSLDEETIKDIQVGMYGRNITKLILDSLRGEIITWAETDRYTRGTTASLKFVKDSDDEGTSDSEVSYVRDQLTNDDSSLYQFSSKNQNRLFMLLERVCQARIVAFLYHYQADIQSAARLVIEYIQTNTPSPIEDYPKHAPSMSFCVLEALLRPISSLASITCPGSKFSPCNLSTPYTSWFGNFLNNLSSSNGSKNLLGNAISISIFASANIWKQRKLSTDRRICEISSIELAAYDRIVESEKGWLNDDYEFDSGTDLLDHIIDVAMKETNDINLIALVFSIELTLQQSGDLNSAVITLQKLISDFKSSIGMGQTKPFIWDIVASIIKACICGIQHFQWEVSCMDALKMNLVSSEMADDERIAVIIDQMTILYSQLDNFDSGKELSKHIHALGSSVLKSCLVLGDGLRAYKAASLILPTLMNGQYPACDCSNELKSTLLLAEIPVIRIINLKCRPDRWKNSIVQAQRHQLFTVLGVADLCLYSPKDSDEKCKETMYWGGYAHSGKEYTHSDFDIYVSQKLKLCNNRKQSVDDFVATHWRPKDLKAFDRFAIDDDKLVRASVSERACALSHVSCWHGIHNTLVSMLRSNVSDHDTSKYRMDSTSVQKLFQISGFARGQAMLVENQDMPPCPVCIVLEDDALLVDRFYERLTSLLNELPRDFHYCSIGFSRPKTAPMVPYSSQLAIPTCLWYCTGYIVSLEGASYLINSLPVVGPVDSWIGLKMTSNWDNVFGQRIGVGNVTKPTIDKDLIPSRKDLCMIMKFRAYAAMTPLCSQKLKWSSSSPNEQKGAKWRDRDTDVTYSGRQ